MKRFGKEKKKKYEECSDLNKNFYPHLLLGKAHKINTFQKDADNKMRRIISFIRIFG